jgi:hypothetical protein
MELPNGFLTIFRQMDIYNEGKYYDRIKILELEGKKIRRVDFVCVFESYIDCSFANEKGLYLYVMNNNFYARDVETDEVHEVDQEPVRVFLVNELVKRFISRSACSSAPSIQACLVEKLSPQQ